MSVSEYPKEVLEALERDQGITFKGKHRSDADARLCYGATCTWFGSIHETKNLGVPRCPHCGGVLFEMPDEGEWWRGSDDPDRVLRATAARRSVDEGSRSRDECLSALNHDS